MATKNNNNNNGDIFITWGMCGGEDEGRGRAGLNQWVDFSQLKGLLQIFLKLVGLCDFFDYKNEQNENL